MPDTTATLSLRDIVFYDGKKFYVTGMRLEPASISGSKVTYQISEFLPETPGGWKTGPFKNIGFYLDREMLQDATQFTVSEISRIESEANTYQRTLTHIPVISLLGDSTSILVIDGTTIYPWDGTSPTYDATSGVPVTSTWIDPGFTITDQEDSGQATDGTIFTATVTHDGTTYTVDSTEFVIGVEITHFDGTNTLVVSNVDLNTEGTYTIKYTALDNQRILSYPVERTIQILLSSNVNWPT